MHGDRPNEVSLPPFSVKTTTLTFDKPGPLNADEWETIRLHPYYTQRILEHIHGFERLATDGARAGGRPGHAPKMIGSFR